MSALLFQAWKVMVLEVDAAAAISVYINCYIVSAAKAKQLSLLHVQSLVSDM